MDKIKIAVVILNYNGAELLKKFLPTVIAHSPTNLAEIIVVDNASTDNSIDILKNEFPNIRLIQIATNLGFAGGYNEALKAIQADYYVLLNSDVEVTANWLEPMYELLRNNENIAACQPKILSFRDKSKFEHAGAAGGFIDRYGYPFCRGRLFDDVETDNNQYNDEIEIFWASGACMMIRSELFHLMEGFDSDFFAHMEEIDLCWRIKQLGYQIYYSGLSTVYHVGGATLDYNSPRKVFLNFRNSRAMLVRNTASNGFISTMFFREVLDDMAFVFFLLKGKFGAAFAQLKGVFTHYFSLAKWFRKRKHLKQKIQDHQIGPPNLTGMIYKSVAIQYFFQKKKSFKQIMNND